MGVGVYDGSEDAGLSLLSKTREPSTTVRSGKVRNDAFLACRQLTSTFRPSKLSRTAKHTPHPMVLLASRLFILLRARLRCPLLDVEATCCFHILSPILSKGLLLLLLPHPSERSVRSSRGLECKYLCVSNWKNLVHSARETYQRVSDNGAAKQAWVVERARADSQIDIVRILFGRGCGGELAVAGL